jgi:HD-like signal output (HDOD) protein
MNDEQEKKIFEKYLPDFSTKAVDIEEAAKQLNDALDKIALEFGHDPLLEEILMVL